MCVLINKDSNDLYHNHNSLCRSMPVEFIIEDNVVFTKLRQVHHMLSTYQIHQHVPYHCQ